MLERLRFSESKQDEHRVRCRVIAVVPKTPVWPGGDHPIGALARIQAKCCSHVALRTAQDVNRTVRSTDEGQRGVQRGAVGRHAAFFSSLLPLIHD